MRIFGFILFFIFSSILYAQDMEALIKGEREAFEVKNNFKSKRSGQAYDLTFQRLQLAIDPEVKNIEGSVYSELTALENGFSQFSFDLDDRMTVDSVWFQNKPIFYVHYNDEITITIPPQDRDDQVDVTIFYHGDPSANEQKGFSYDYQFSGPISWTLSEPYGAYGWWPCKQQLVDKIDSFDMVISVPKGNKAAGLGNLIRVDTLSDKSLVYHWQHRYPVATYLVAVAVTNYYEESHYIPLSDGDSIFHLDYLYPSYKSQADTLRLAIDPMMRSFDSLFGAYPFRKEKYGHAMFGRGGGMEHQTMSFMSRLDFDLMAHELAHQWFGNKITCGSWQDLWLNESWATYATAIAREQIKTRAQFHEFLIKCIERGTRNNGGAVFAYDTSNVNELFSGDIRYRKGAMVLHQLRWTIGDSAFFAGTKNYLANASLCYGFAYTPDFINAMEEASGMDLTDFFDRYVYLEGFPMLDVKWNRMNAHTIYIQLNQTTSHPSVDFFPLSIQLKAIGEGGDTTFTIHHTQPQEAIQVELGKRIEELIIDPNYWNLAKYTVVEGYHNDMNAITIYPNPTQDIMNIYAKDKKVDRVEIINVVGEVISTHQIRSIKSSSIPLDVSQLSQGMYFVRITAEGNHTTTKLMKD